jgi:hypothetical protein
MKTNILLFTVLLIIANACIILKHKKSDDGSTTLTRSDSALIVPFCSSDILREWTRTGKEEVRFQVIDAGKLDTLISLKPFSWIFIGASWCGATHIAIQQYAHSIRRLNSDSIQWIVIYQEYNLPDIQNEVFMAGAKCPVYLLDSKKYGSHEADKQVNLVKDLHWGLDIQPFIGGGIPKSLIVGSDHKVYYYASGFDIRADTIVKYTGLHKKFVQ